MQASDIDWGSVPGSIELGDPPASPSLHLIGTCSDVDMVDTADMDSDGDQDVASASEGGLVCIWKNMDGFGTLWAGSTVGTGSTSYGLVSAVDIDLDSDIDLFCGRKWFENADGLGQSWITHNFVYSSPSSMSVIDIDGDDDIDVVLSFSYASCIYWYENEDGVGSSWTSHQISVPAYQNGAQASAGDIDGDGDVDIVLFERDDPLFLQYLWIENTDGSGSSWTQHSMSAEGGFCWDLHTIDADQDGDSDLLAACEDDGACMYENLDGQGGSWAVTDVDGPVSDARDVEHADFDLDGDIDLACAYLYGSYDAAWWENLDGSGGQWLGHDLDTGFQDWGGLDAADVDSNGDPDLVISSSSVLCWIDLGAPGGLNGTLLSSILYTGNDPDWNSLGWTSQEPSGTAVGFQVRASDNPSAMGPWSDTLWTPGPLDGLLADDASYLQYRAILESSVPGVTPSLEEVTVSWDPLGVGGEELPGAFTLLGVVPNPCQGVPSVGFGLPGAETVGISVFDISGRLVADETPVVYGPGWHEVRLCQLRTGIYFVRIQAGEFEATKRFAVIGNR